MEQIKDSYLTIEDNAEAIFKERSSKFLCYAFHVESEEEIAACLEPLYKRYYDATHHCYAWRLGPFGERFRANDDGEPSSTAGKPILGQLLSREITNCLIVVVRYFGGTKLGVPGLIAAYKESAAAVLDVATIVERTVDTRIKIDFSYVVMNDGVRQPLLNDSLGAKQQSRYRVGPPEKGGGGYRRCIGIDLAKYLSR